MKFTPSDMDRDSSSEEEDGSCFDEESQGRCGEPDLKNSFDKQTTDEPLPDDDTVRTKVFESGDEAEKWYYHYARQMGFNPRRYSCKIKQGILKNRVWQCNRGGRDNLKPRSQLLRKPKETANRGCEARFRVSHNCFDGKYRVTTFHSSHNHPLETPETSHRLKCNRYILPSQKAVLSSFKDVGIRTCQSIDYLEYTKGGPGNLTFREKDAYNFLNKYRLSIMRHGDVNTAIGLLEGMKVHDPNLIFEKTVADDQSLSRLFWTDGFSRAAYAKFGDLLVVDSTYKTNAYKFPLVILSGVDNHSRNIVFGAALMYNETIESYVWLFKTFLAAMGGKAPLSIVTDQDDAMRAAIKAVFPKARHRLCGWHLARNCKQNIKVTDFYSPFGRLMRKKSSIFEFEREWVEVTQKHGIANNSWIKDTYKIRELWGEAYFRGHFMARTRTTQRAESLNATFKRLGKAGSTITEFLKHYHGIVAKMRSTFSERQEDCELSRSSIRRGASLYSLQSHCSTVFTKDVFAIVHKQILKEQDLIVVEKRVRDDALFEGTLAQYGLGDEKKWRVKINVQEGKFMCECQMLESDGLPCSHLFTAFKHMNLQAIPFQCIRTRWSTSTGKELRAQFPKSVSIVDPQRRRHALIMNEYSDLALKASQSDSATEMAIKRARLMAKEVQENVFVQSKSGPLEEQFRTNNELRDPMRNFKSAGNVCDPKKVRSRGAPKAKKQNCSACHKPGHKSTTCPEKTNKSVDKNKISSDLNGQNRDYDSEEI